MGGRGRGGGREIRGSEGGREKKGRRVEEKGEPGRGTFAVALNAPSWVGRCAQALRLPNKGPGGGGGEGLVLKL